MDVEPFKIAIPEAHLADLRARLQPVRAQAEKRRLRATDDGLDRGGAR